MKDERDRELAVFTAREYLETFEPGVLDFILEPDLIFKADTERALEFANNWGVLPTVRCGKLAFPADLWHVIYP